MGLSPNPFNLVQPSADAANPFQTPPTGPSPFDAPPATVPMPPAMAAPAPPKDPMILDDETYEDAAPSREDLLQRAAALGPARMTWASIVLQPTDPILSKKMQPQVAARRARFRKIVKVALGACMAFCVVATAATAMSSGPEKSASTSTSTSTSTTSRVKTAPATGVVPVEKLEQPTLTKATRHAKASTAARPRTLKKRR